MLLSVFVDLRKAFDTVCHNVILEKLAAIGIKDCEYQWFVNYMSRRQQFTVVESYSSERKHTNIGVQQGSLLGVLLFQLIINDLPNCLKFSTSILYADDTTIFVYGKSLCFLKAKLQSDLNSLADWLSVNSLKLNVKKTKTMLFNAEGLTPNINLMIYGESIECATEFKFLGLTLDVTLAFDQHFLNLYRKLMQAHFIIHKLNKIFPNEVLWTLYFAYYHSNLMYCLLVWYPLLHKKHQNSLYMSQKRMIRLISGVSLRAHCMPLFKARNVLVIQDQLTLENCKLIYRVESKNCPLPIVNLFEVGQYNTRCNINMRVHRSAKYNNSFLCKSILDWTKLEMNCRAIDKIKPFAKRIKADLIRKYLKENKNHHFIPVWRLLHLLPLCLYISFGNLWNTVLLFSRW